MFRTYLIIIIFLLLTSCTSNENVVKFENQDFKVAYIQKVEDNRQTDEVTEPVNKNKLSKIKSTIEGTKLEELNNEDYVTKMKQETYYQIVLSQEKDPTNGDFFTFIVFEDGTLIYPDLEDEQGRLSYISTDSKPTLTSDIKKTLNIEF